MSNEVKQIDYTVEAEVGMVVWQDKLGIGKVVTVNADGTCWVAFLWYMELVKIDTSALALPMLTDEHRKLMDTIVRDMVTVGGVTKNLVNKVVPQKSAITLVKGSLDSVGL